MTDKQQYEIEFPINTSPKVLYSRLNTAGGLAEWFADDVTLEGNIFTFIWEGFEQRAEKIAHKDNKSVRFRWIDDEDDESFFEFRITQDDITGDVSLMVTDFASEEEIEDSKVLWNKQVDQLMSLLGSANR